MFWWPLIHCMITSLIIFCIKGSSRVIPLKSVKQTPYWILREKEIPYILSWGRKSSAIRDSCILSTYTSLLKVIATPTLEHFFIVCSSTLVNQSLVPYTIAVDIAIVGACAGSGSEKGIAILARPS